jgi:formate hydrogenlyase transcriptional activator
VENGPRELELLLRAIVYHPSFPILIADNDGNYREASAGAGKLLGLPREKIIGRQIDDFAQSGFKPQVSQLWRAFLEHGEHEGTLQLVGADGAPRDVQYTAKGNVLPVRHVLALGDKNASAENGHALGNRIPSWVRDCALYVLDVEGCVAAWYGGASRIYGYEADQAVEQHVSMLYPSDDMLEAVLQEEFSRATIEGHVGSEGWQARKDGSASGRIPSPWRCGMNTGNCRALHFWCSRFDCYECIGLYPQSE